MAQVALDYINERITQIQDEIRQALKVRDAAVADANQKVAAKEKELADWAEVLDRYHGTQDAKPAPAKKTAAKKTTAPKKD